MTTLVRKQEHRTRPIGSWDLATARPLSSLFNDFDQLFNELATPPYSRSQWAQGYPADLYETGEEIVLEMAVPGINVDDLDISIEGRQLTIRGALPNMGGEDRRYWLQSIPRGEFHRTVNLPVNVEVEEVRAAIQNGLLVLRMPKVAAARARRITIDHG